MENTTGQQATPELPPISSILTSAGHDFWLARRTLLKFSSLFKLAEAWVLLPATALFLAWVLARGGYVAISNMDLLAFFLTPLGLIYAAGLATVALALLLFEQAGAMVVVSSYGKERLSIRRLIQIILQKMFRIFELGVWAGGLLLLALTPLILLAGITYQVLLTEYDIYFYLNARPPEFWKAVGIGSILLAAALAISAILIVRWSLALPILVFEHQNARAAIRASRERIRGCEWRAGAILVGWTISVLLLGGLAGAAFRWLACQALQRAGEQPLVLTFALLVAETMLVASISLVFVLGFALLTRRIYLSCTPHRDPTQTPLSSAALPQGEPATNAATNKHARWLLLLLLVPPLAVWTKLVDYLPEAVPVLITAHRGHARAAPENTLSAVRKAMESGADFAEIDIQRTADGVVVLLHDRDLKRVAADPRRLEDLTFDELRKLDVGSWFDPAFAGEKVPTLTEVIELCRGRMRLNIELKFYGPDRQLAADVARIIREQAFEQECIVTSLNLDSLEVIRAHNPNVRTGLIVAHAAGDISRLDVDVLSIRADFLSRDLLRLARRQGREVHAWTVNDATQMARLMQRGVDNILTSDPDLAIRVRAQWAALTRPERLLLAARLLLGLDAPDITGDELVLAPADQP